jgi:two-component system sensor histidine kinase and response regulator WspE
MSEELGDFSMLELFRLEVNNQARILSDGLLALEQDAQDARQLEALMRAAHSIKGAARMVDVDAGVKLAHAMEDCFVAAQKGELVLRADQIDVLLKGVDQLIAISRQETDDALLARLCEQISNIEHLNEAGAEHPPSDLCTTAPETSYPVSDNCATAANEPEMPAAPAREDVVELAAATPTAVPATGATGSEKAVRVSADSLNRLVGLAGEVQVESRWLRPFAEALVQIKHRQAELIGL